MHQFSHHRAFEEVIILMGVTQVTVSPPDRLDAIKASLRFGMFDIFLASIHGACVLGHSCLDPKPWEDPPVQGDPATDDHHDPQPICHPYTSEQALFLNLSQAKACGYRHAGQAVVAPFMGAKKGITIR
jgi:hypothetical protein